MGKTYAGARGQSTCALRDVGLSVGAGESVAIVGGSGCGKSTLLRVIGGLERHDQGRVIVGDAAVTGPGPDRGMMFQEHRLLPWLTVGENVEFGLNHLDPPLRRRTALEQIELVGLGGFERAYPHQLSGGMAQRVALARALAPSPGVLLLDEPFAALDAFTKAHLQEELLRVRAAFRPTLVLVTHDLEEAVFLADRIVVMSDRPGTIQSVVDVKLPHPRERTSEAFTRLRSGVLHDFFERRSDVTERALVANRSSTALPPSFSGALLPRESP